MVKPMGIHNIKLLLTDVDGILNDGKTYAGVKEEYVRFDIQDGIGQKLAEYGGLLVGWISGRNSKPVAARAKKLKVPILYQGKLDKLTIARQVCRKYGYSLSQVAYMGDDLIDLPLLIQAGWSATVPNGRPEVKRAVDYVTHARGGDGAFREVVEKILKSQGVWMRTIHLFHQANNHAPSNHSLFG
jgi:YrbI family 3-deoxy-D-manno-octulosonate 8-phosphate phosphatase